MKKKILFGFSVFTIAVVLIFNIAIATNGSNSTLSSELSLNSLGFFTHAQAEGGTTTKCESGVLCEDANGLHYGTKTDSFGAITCCGIATVTAGRKAS